MIGKTAVGVDLGGTKMILLAESQGQRLTRVLSTGKAFGSRDVQSSLKRFLADLAVVPAYLEVAIPGLVDAQGKVIACDVLPGIEGVDKASFEFAGCPVHLINDAEAALVEESCNLPASAASVIIMVGTGIGMAFKMNGSLCRGSRGWAGELGKIPVSCREGVQTLDELASGASIVARLGGGIGSINERIVAHDSEATECVKTAGWALGLGLASAINLLNPELMILGGGTLNYPGYYQAALDSGAQHAMPEPWKACTIRRPREQELVVALGALRYAQTRSMD
jgi:predicted NBD/HSP70 family sugar kinase